MNEPEFWEDRIFGEPICNSLIEKFNDIKNEILLLKQNYPKFFTKYPKFKIEDPKTNKNVKMYENDWTITALSNLTGEYDIENNKASKVGGDSLEKLVNRYRHKVIPTLHNIIDKPNKEGILTNVFVSILSPGVIIRPHKGYSKEYMRIHLGLVCDSDCKITVGDQTRTWEEGKILAFKDGGPYYHSVNHEGSMDRYILSFDLKLNYLQEYIKV